MEDRYRGTCERLFRVVQRLRDFAVANCKGKIDKITLAQEKIILSVFDHPEGAMLKDIARDLHLTPGAVSQAIEVMVQEGMLERRVSKRDRRAVTILPTEKSQRHRQMNGALFMGVMEEVFGGAPESELRAFNSILDRILTTTIAHHDRLHRRDCVASPEGKGKEMTA